MSEQTETKEELQTEEPEWVGKVRQEALKFVSVTEQNLAHGMVGARKMIPIEDDQNLRRQLDTFFEAIFAMTVSFTGRYYNLSEEAEEMVVGGVREKFALLRRMQITDRIMATPGPTRVLQ